MAELRADAGLRLRTGAMVPSIGCGTMFLRGSLCEKVVSTALSMGYRLVDTASMYGNEREVGDAIRRSGVPREELFVVSKVKPDDMGYDATLAACAKSRAELGLDYLDAYLVHAPGGSRQAPARLILPLCACAHRARCAVAQRKAAADVACDGGAAGVGQVPRDRRVELPAAAPARDRERSGPAHPSASESMRVLGAQLPGAAIASLPGNHSTLRAFSRWP